MDRKKKINLILKGIAVVAVATGILYFISPLIINMFTGTEITTATTEENDVLPGDEVDFTEYEAELAKEASDIDGMTKLDKLNAGLQVKDGSDTDGDGLTDKEELEIYHSDPHKMSTAGDFYSDGYKVKNGMDLTQKYNSDNIEYANNSCKEVTLSAITLEDTYAYVQTVPTDIYQVAGHKIYKAYNIYGYTGNVAIDVSDILNTNDTTIKKLDIYAGDMTGYNLSPVKAKRKDSSISFDMDGEELLILITEKNGVSLKMGSNTGLRDLNGEEAIDGDGLIWGFTLAPAIGIEPKVYYVSTGDDAKDAALKNELAEFAELITDANLIRKGGTFFRSQEDYMITASDCKMISQSKLDVIRATLGRMPEEFHLTGNSTEQSPIITYCNYEDIAGINRESVVGDYDYHKDELPFGNFSTELSPNGSCAGIAHLTAYVHNNGGIEPSGSYDVEGYGTISWDLSNDEENSTFMDPYLYDYKTKTFVKDHKDSNGLLSGLSDAEEQFKNMIIGYWKESNEKVETTSYVKYNSLNEHYSYELIELMKDYLDTGKILEAGMISVEKDGDPATKPQSAHAVNIISYEETNDPNVTIFRIYDCNYPDQSEFINGFPMVVTRHGDTFSYSYAHSNNSKRIMTSDAKYVDRYCFVISDEKWNILNDMVEE